jgi:hypothetical protein
MRVRATALVLAASITSSGCSVFLTKSRPDHLTPASPPDCTTSKTPVFVDGTLGLVGAAANPFLGLYALSKKEDYDDGETNPWAVAWAVNIVVAAGLLTSALIGHYTVKHCREAHEEWNALRAAPPPQPQPSPPPSPY